jgi:dihydrofolate reductase
MVELMGSYRSGSLRDAHRWNSTGRSAPWARGLPMRRIRYRVTTSLDGYIAGPKGEYDWIVPDPDRDFLGLFNQFDTVLLGRHTYELTLRPDAPPWPPGIRVVVFSRTLRPRDHPGVTMVTEKIEEAVADLRAQSGKDLWLFGGASLFRSLLAVRLVDTVEIAVIPVLLGEGIPLLLPPAKRAKLKLTGHHASRAGIVSLEYVVSSHAEH